ncbi:hypothetical protein [Phenylobacterium sp.]|jgi:hypothetical protein|uniref:hypothetical protein n=1 Tax=Phenylobacterium sp. TaxID=1871053 RepID=UPI002E2F24DD|nr:hypothetical protein [Phenylobacterium sp.]HEX3363697.1 hypothetical protein [Phenylobacterium sp.]
MLAELAEIGMDLAREVGRQALDQSAEAPSAADLALTFSRVARAVRQTVAPEARLAEDSRKDRAERAALSVADRWRSARRKRQVREIVGEVIEVEADGDYDADRLLAERDERLEDGDEEADFADRPIGELVARICRDLNIIPDWSLFEDADWAIEEARARPPGSPFAAESSGSGNPDETPSDPPWPTHHPPRNGSSH